MFSYYVAMQQVNISRNHENIDQESMLFLEPKRRKFMFNSIKKLTSTVFDFMCDIGQASYAAHLARNQQWQRAQDLYKK